MNGYLLSPAAQADLGQIWDYSTCKWGEDRANRYIPGIRDACGALAEGSRQGRPIDAIRPGCRKLAAASHFLFYRVSDSGLVDMVRILHQRMNVAEHLQD